MVVFLSLSKIRALAIRGMRTSMTVGKTVNKSMKTVSKKEIVKTVAEELAMPASEVAQVVQGFMDQLVDELARGNRLEFREFGIFDLKERKARKARNPRTGDEVLVAAKTVVVFKPGKRMKERVDTRMRTRLGDSLGI
jgi:integration host factor subunit beta